MSDQHRLVYYDPWEDSSDDGELSVTSNVSSEDLKSQNSSFYSDVVGATLHQREQKQKQLCNSKNRPFRRTRHIDRVHNAILDLRDDILYTLKGGWKYKVLDAANNGFSNVNIFEYHKGAKYRNFPIVLLVAGPHDNTKFFEDNGMFSVVEEIDKVVS